MRRSRGRPGGSAEPDRLAAALDTSTVGPTEPTAAADARWVHRRHLAAEQPGRAAAAVVGSLLVVALAARLFGSPVFAVLGGLFVFGSLADFLLPCTWRLTTAGAERRGFLLGRQLAWPRVQRAYVLPDGVLLSPLPKRTWLDTYRGLFVPAGDDRDGLLQLVDQLAADRRRPATEADRDPA